MEESLVEVGSFEWRHAPIFSGFAVEKKVGGDYSAAYDGTAVEELGCYGSCIRARDLRRRLHVGAVEGIASFGQSGEG